MKILRINHRLALRYILGAFLLCFSVIFVTAHSTYANTTIDGKYIKRIKGKKAKNYGIQGGTLTDKYYIFADSNSAGDTNGLTTIRFVDRKTGKDLSVDSSLIMQDFAHANSVNYEWGTEYAQVEDVGGFWCFSIKERKLVSDNKCNFVKSYSLGVGSPRQGWTKYGDYYFRASGNEHVGNVITVYDKNRNPIESFNVPLGATDTCEIEDVAVDGNEGVLYMICDDKERGHEVGYYKIDKSVFSNYIAPSSSSISGQESGSSAARKKQASDYESENNFNPAVSTYDGVIDTTFFGTIQDNEEGCGVYVTLDFIMTILTIGIGITALIGITISGILYLTAKGDVARTTKAKRRIYEIIIGLAAYAAIWGILTFLLPEFNPELKACKTLTPEEIAARNEELEAKRKASQQSSSSTDLSAWYKAYAKQAEYMKNANYGGNKKSNFARSKREGTDITYVSTSLQRLGVIPKNKYVWYNCGLAGTAAKYIKEHEDVFQVTYPNKTVSQLYKKGQIKRGDIVFYQYGSSCGVGHTMIFVGFNTYMKPLFDTFDSSGMRTNYAHQDGNKKVKMLIHLKKTSVQ